MRPMNDKLKMNESDRSYQSISVRISSLKTAKLIQITLF
jgi:hypothetical protein